MPSNPDQLNSDSVSEFNVPGATAVWRFEETSGTTAQDSIGANPGTLSGGATRIATGRQGRAVQFDGSNENGETWMWPRSKPRWPGVTRSSPSNECNARAAEE